MVEGAKKMKTVDGGGGGGWRRKQKAICAPQLAIQIVSRLFLVSQREKSFVYYTHHTKLQVSKDKILDLTRQNPTPSLLKVLMHAEPKFKKICNFLLTSNTSSLSSLPFRTRNGALNSTMLLPGRIHCSRSQSTWSFGAHRYSEFVRRLSTRRWQRGLFFY